MKIKKNNVVRNPNSGILLRKSAKIYAKNTKELCVLIALKISFIRSFNLNKRIRIIAKMNAFLLHKMVAVLNVLKVTITGMDVMVKINARINVKYLKAMNILKQDMEIVRKSPNKMPLKMH